MQNTQLSNSTLESSQTISPVSQIDMETQPVNLNSNSNPVDGIVNDEVTNQIFGVVSDALRNKSDMPEMSSGQSEGNFDQEPILSTFQPANVSNNDIYVDYINALRNQLTKFYNDMNMELDKLQEKIFQNSEAVLVDDDSKEEVVNKNVQIPVNNNSAMAIGNEDNIFDIQSQSLSQQNLEETMVIPRVDFNNAIESVQNVMSM